jgi:alpha-L-fucosidase 2
MSGGGKMRGDPFREDPYQIVLKAPIEKWDEALPLGNGLTGGLLWGGDGGIRLSLDRGDLWDLRDHPILSDESFTYDSMVRMVREGRNDELNEKHSHISPFPTKLPGGRLVVDIDSKPASVFRLDMRRAMGAVDFGGTLVECYFPATDPLAIMTLPGMDPSFRLVPNRAVEELGYKPAEIVAHDDRAWFVQDAALCLRYVVYCEMWDSGEGKRLATTVTTNRDSDDPIQLAVERIESAREEGLDDLRSKHLEWWSDFWASSSVELPDLQTQRHYNLVQYLYGSGSRSGAPPLPLQGLWTADEGELPPWHGDYHNDLNTQLTYWSYLASGRFEQGSSFLEFMWSLKEHHEELARGFFGLDVGHVVPGVMSLDGKVMGGWLQYSLSPTLGAWVAHSFHLHWLHTMDRVFLAQRAYPYCSGIAQALLGLMECDPQRGKLLLPLSTSPEIHNNYQESWMTPNSNFDLSLVRWILLANEGMADVLGREEDARYWRDSLGRLDDLALNGTGLMVSPDESLTESHRHFSHLVSIHPLGLINVDGGPDHLRIIEDSLRHIRNLGTSAWCGYSHSWMACILARVGDGNGSLRLLRDFLSGFTLRNGFHANGEQTRKGLSDYHFRAFTLEGNFAAGQAVHEMLLQSWGGKLRVFPAVPDEWQDVSFQDLRAEGGFIVSATRLGGQTQQVRVRATVDGYLRMRNPFPGGSLESDAELEVSADEITLHMEAGQSVNMRPA